MKPIPQLLGKTSPKFNNFITLAFILIAYACIGCMIILNVTRGNSHSAYYVHHQFCATMLCIACAFVIFCLPDKLFRAALLPACAIGYLSLWGLFIFSHPINGSYGWYRCGTLSIQPAEFTKPLFIIALALLCKKLECVQSTARRLLFQLAFAALVMLPIALQPDFGTVLVYAITFTAVIWSNGMPNKYLLGFAGIAVAGSVFAFFRFPHVQRRFTSFANALFANSFSQQGSHAQRLQECIVKGGWSGSMFQPSDSLNALPYRYSDSLFAGASELLGAAGAIPIVLICLGWQYYCCNLAYKEANPVHRLIYVGSGTMLASQALIHLAVNLGLMPNTGIPMPMLSYGGSSLLATFLIVTLVQRLSLKP